MQKFGVYYLIAALQLHTPIAYFSGNQYLGTHTWLFLLRTHEDNDKQGMENMDANLISIFVMAL